MRITIEIPDEEVHRVLAPLVARDVASDTEAAPQTLPAVMRITEAASHLAVSPHSLYQMVARGEVASVKIGRSIRIPTESIASFIREGSLRQKQEKEAASEQWREWVTKPRVVRPQAAGSATAAASVKAQPKPLSKRIDLSPRPRPAEPRGWTRAEQLGVLQHMEEGGWPTELTALMLEDWDAGMWRPYVLRAADLAQLLKISPSTAGAMIKRGRVPSFSPEPAYRNERRETLVSVLDYQRLVGNHQAP
jgi:excisionase family DNA binding protein